MAARRWQEGKDDKPARRPPPRKHTRSRWRTRAEEPKEGPIVSRPMRNGILGVFGLVIVLALIVVIVWWLNPLPPPRLAMLTARYRGPLLDANAYALGDAEVLCAQKSVLETGRADPGSLSFDEMAAKVENIATIEPGRYWFMWEKTTTVVYVNALGVALWDPSTQEAIPYLLPDDFEVPVQHQPVANYRAVSLQSVTDSLSRCKADQKILVLDCQRMDHLFPLGVLTNEFVDAALAQLRTLDPSAREGLHVILSCSPGEITWADNTLGQSPFGYYFARGIAGAADADGGDDDGRITLAELFQYVERHVLKWARANRAVAQTPQLESFGQEAGNVSLVALASDAQFVASEPGQRSDPRRLNRRLRSAWRNYYVLARENPAPYQFAPHLWRYLEDTLMRAEQFGRAGDVEAMRNELFSVAAREQDIREAREEYALVGRSFSLAMDAFISGTAYIAPDLEPLEEETPEQPAKTSTQTSAKTSTEAPPAGKAAKSESTEKPAASPPAPKQEDDLTPEQRQVLVSTPQQKNVDFLAVVQSVTGPGQEVAQAAKVLSTGRYRRETPPIEAHLIRMLNDHLLARLTSRPSAGLDRQMRELVSLRVLAEQAAVPAGLAAPDVFRWVKRRVDEADERRRLHEDRFFAEPAIAVPVGAAEPPRLAGNAQRDYQQAIEDAQILARAFRFRQQLLAELPHLAALVAKRQWPRKDQELRESVAELTEKLLKGAGELTDLIRATPDRSVPQDEIDRRVRGIDSLCGTLSEQRQTLTDQLIAETRELGDSKGPPRTQNDWRRIDDILTVPFPCAPGDPTESARVRVNLVERSLNAVLQAGEARAPAAEGARQVDDIATVDAQARQRHAVRLAQTAEKLYALGTGASLPVESGAPALVGVTVARAWRQLYDLAVTRTVDLGKFEELFQAEAARRVLDGYAAKKGEYSYVQELRRLNLAALYAWHAERFAKDFWAGVQGDTEPYFMVTAREYLKRAQRLDPRGPAATRSQGELLDLLEKLADSLRLRSPVSKVRFRGTDEQPIELDVSCGNGYPIGVGVLRAGADSESVELRDVETRRLPCRYKAVRRTAQGDAANFAADIVFRGHVAKLRIPMVLSNDEDGFTVVYVDSRGSNAEYDVRLAEADKSDQRILFLLDWSMSMSSGSPSRISQEKEVLSSFIETTPDKAIDVGVRVFGHRFKMKNADDKENERLSMKDTQLLLPVAPFSRELFEKKVLDLMAPKGDTPLFQALIDAKDDFAKVRGKNKSLIVISDGADSFLGLPGYPGPDELRRAYAGTDIRINTIGFQVEDADFEQLKDIARVGGGKARRVSQGPELLREVSGLLGLLRYTAISGGNMFPNPPRTLDVLANPIAVRPGVYDVRVTASDNQALDSLRDLPFRRGERHQFLFESGRLQYMSDQFTEALASAEDSSTGVSLYVLQAKPQQGGLTVDWALVRKGASDWRPQKASIYVRPRGRQELYTMQNLEPNVPGYHVPVWRTFIEEWPADAGQAEIEVRWVEPTERISDRYSLNYKEWQAGTFAGKLPTGFKLTRWSTEDRNIDGKLRNSLLIKLVFPENQRDIQQWSISFDDSSIEYARQIYNTDEGVYTGVFVFEGQRVPADLTLALYQPRKRQQGRVLETTVSVRARAINR